MRIVFVILFAMLVMSPIQQEKPSHSPPKTKTEKIITMQIHSLEEQIYRMEDRKSTQVASVNPKLFKLKDSLKTLSDSLTTLQKIR